MRTRLIRSLMIAALTAAAGLVVGCSGGSTEMHYGDSGMKMGASQTNAATTRTMSPAPVRRDSFVRSDPHVVVSFQSGASANAGRAGTVDPVTGEPYRHYNYYPNSEVYLDVRQSRYFWRDGREWKSGMRLPSMIESSITWSDFERIGLPTDRPFDMHRTVVERYPSLSTVRRQARAIQKGGSNNAFATVPTDR